MGDGARDHRFEAGLGEERQPLAGALEPWRQSVEFGRDQFRLEIPSRRLAVPAHMRGLGLVRPDENAVGLLAQIGMRVGIAHHRQFHFEIDQFLERLGDHVVMQHVGDRHIVPGP